MGQPLDSTRLELTHRPLRPERRSLMSRNHGKHVPSKGYVERNLCLLCLQWPVLPLKRAFTVHQRASFSDIVAQSIYHREMADFSGSPP